MASERKTEITRLLKGKTIDYTWFTYKPIYGTRKNRRNQRFSPFLMRSSKNRSDIRRYENRKYRRDKFNLAPHKKVGINYKWSLW